MLSSLGDGLGTVGTQRYMVGAKLLALAWLPCTTTRMSLQLCGLRTCSVSAHAGECSIYSQMTILQGQHSISISQMDKLRPGESA